MKKLFLIFVLLLLATSANGQIGGNTARHIRYASSLPATCSPSTGDVVFLTTGAVGVYQCLSTNTWTVASAAQFPTGTDIGSATKPPRYIFLYGDGTYGSTSIKLTASPTTNRTVTISDNSFTIAEGLLASVASVDMNTATATTLYTCPTGKTCVITRAIVRNASTNLTTVSASFGWTAAAYNDWTTTLTFATLTDSTHFRLVSPINGATVGTAGGTFKVLDNILQGAAATVTIDVFGYVF